MLDAIRDKLATIQTDGKIYYGLPPKLQEYDAWDYMVYNRATIAKGSIASDYIRYYRVAIVRDGCIPPGLEISVINALSTIPNLRLANDGGQYTFYRKADSGYVVEACVLMFAESLKGA